MPPLLCDVDPDEFAAKCKAPLFPGEWQIWLLHRTLSSAGAVPAQNELEVLLGATALQRLTGIRGPWGDGLGNQLAKPELKYVADHLQAYDLTGTDITIRGEVDADALADRLEELGRLTQNQTLELVASRATLEGCPVLPTTKGKSTTILLLWYYNGTLNSTPWPVHTYLSLSPHCPVGNDWQLDSVYRPAVRKDKPTSPRPVVPPLPDGVTPGLALVPIAVMVLGGAAVTYAVVKAVR